MTDLEFWRALCAIDERRILKVVPAGAIDGEEWSHVIWPWAGFRGLFPRTEAGLEQATERLAAAEAGRKSNPHR